MNSSNGTKNKGFISIILLIIVGLVILYYLHIPLSYILSLQATKNIGHIIVTLVKVLWSDFVLLIQFVKDLVSGAK